MNKEWLDTVNEQLELILEEAVFDEVAEKVFIRHYGIKCKRMDPKAISKELKIPVKKLRAIIDKIDNKVFNILKKHAFIA